MTPFRLIFLVLCAATLAGSTYLSWTGAGGASRDDPLSIRAASAGGGAGRAGLNPGRVK